MVTDAAAPLGSACLVSLIHADQRTHVFLRAGRKVVRRFLVKWARYDASHNSWERESNLVSCDEVLADYWQRYNRDHRVRSSE